jgi:hypothetical protein
MAGLAAASYKTSEKLERRIIGEQMVAARPERALTNLSDFCRGSDPLHVGYARKSRATVEGGRQIVLIDRKHPLGL